MQVFLVLVWNIVSGGSRTAATSKMQYFATIVNGFQPLTIIKKHSISDDAAALDPPLIMDAEVNLSLLDIQCLDASKSWK